MHDRYIHITSATPKNTERVNTTDGVSSQASALRRKTWLKLSLVLDNWGPNLQPLRRAITVQRLINNSTVIVNLWSNNSNSSLILDLVQVLHAINEIKPEVHRVGNAPFAYLCQQQVRKRCIPSLYRPFNGSRLSLDWTWTGKESCCGAQTLKKRRIGVKTVALS